ncbi:MAG: hypothetical protein QXX41_12295 [Nitrososphaerota archaeon]
MLKKERAIMLIVLTATLMLLASSAATIVKAEETAQTARIWTDKEDYAPGETVIIYGEGFQGTVTIIVVRPDGTVNDPENGIVGEWTVIADENGMFETTYKLDGILGEYTVTATDEYGNTATTTFTDANKVNFQTSGLPSGVTITINLTIDPGSDQKSVTFTSPGPSGEVTTGANKTVTYSGFPQSVTVGGFTYVLDGTSPSSPFSTGPGSGTVTVTATYKQYVPNADLYIMKSGPQYAHVGDTITFMFNVNNAGPDSATGVVVTDDKAGTATYASGDTNSNEMLDVGETWIFTATYEVSETDLDPLTNTATVTSTTLDPQISNNKASWSVDVLHPGIDVKKTGPEYAHERDEITYTITVENTGDCPLYNVEIGESYAGTILVGYMDVGDKKTFEVKYTVPSPSGDITNVVNAQGEDVLGLLVQDDDSWSVDVLHPEISVSKSGPNYAHEGDIVTYTITVENTGDCELTGVTVIDDILGDLTSYLPDTTLTVGEVNQFTVNYEVPSPTGDITNTVEAKGEDALGLEVSDSDSWTVDILHPSIYVSKTGPVYAHEEDKITYNITVKNTGDCPLFNVVIKDETLNFEEEIDELAVGEEKTYEVEYTVESYGLLRNTVTASGEDALGLEVSDSASWTVVVLPKSMVTTSRLCYFDFDSAKEGQQFRLIFTQDPTNPSTYKLTASNPGQFYYNVFYIRTSGDSVSLTIKIPYPFVTQGAVPIHVYSDVDIVGGCFIPSGDITGSFSINPKIITLEDYVEITVNGPVPESGLVYVTIHLDYGLKKTVGYTPDSDKNAEKPIGTEVIVNYASYTFEVSGDLTDSQTIQSVNVFKRDPGFAGIVTDSEGNPSAGVEVKIYGPDGKLLATVETDEDGWYFFNYKHTGKAATYTIVCNVKRKL